MPNIVTFHASIQNGKFAGWAEFSAGYAGPVVTVTYLPPPLGAAEKTLLDKMRQGVTPEGPEHVHIATAVTEHAVVVPSGADVIVISNCGGGSGP